MRRLQFRFVFTRVHSGLPPGIIRPRPLLPMTLSATICPATPIQFVILEVVSKFRNREGERPREPFSAENPEARQEPRPPKRFLKPLLILIVILILIRDGKERSGLRLRLKEDHETLIYARTVAFRH